MLHGIYRGARGAHAASPFPWALRFVFGHVTIVQIVAERGRVAGYASERFSLPFVDMLVRMHADILRASLFFRLGTQLGSAAPLVILVINGCLSMGPSV